MAGRARALGGKQEPIGRRRGRVAGIARQSARGALGLALLLLWRPGRRSSGRFFHLSGAAPSSWLCPLSLLLPFLLLVPLRGQRGCSLSLLPSSLRRVDAAGPPVGAQGRAERSRRGRHFVACEGARSGLRSKEEDEDAKLPLPVAALCDMPVEPGQDVSTHPSSGETRQVPVKTLFYTLNCLSISWWHSLPRVETGLFEVPELGSVEKAVFSVCGMALATVSKQLG